MSQTDLISDNDFILLQLHALELFCLCCFAALLVLGATNRVVVCRDMRDLRWTMSPAPILLISLLCGVFLARGTDDPGPIIAGSTGLGWCVSMLALARPLAWSIEDNGFLVGPIIFGFKVIACPALMLLSLASFARAPGIAPRVDRYGRFHAGRGIGANWLLACAGVTWLLVRLVNGDQVQHRRMLQRQMRPPIDITPRRTPKRLFTLN